MENKDYKPVQIPKESYEKLKLYCKNNGFKLGKFLEILIDRNCVVVDKNRILKVNN